MYNIYYELHNDHEWGYRYWVETNLKRSGSISSGPNPGIRYHNYTMNIADRAWLESDYTVTYIKNRHGELETSPHMVLSDFNYVKSKARNLTMMSMRKFSDGIIYVAFPPVNKGSFNLNGDYKIPDGLEEWIEQNTKADWGLINDKKTGVFLSEADATAFKLKWM